MQRANKYCYGKLAVFTDNISTFFISDIRSKCSYTVFYSQISPFNVLHCKTLLLFRYFTMVPSDVNPDLATPTVPLALRSIIYICLQLSCKRRNHSKRPPSTRRNVTGTQSPGIHVHSVLKEQWWYTVYSSHCTYLQYINLSMTALNCNTS